MRFSNTSKQANLVRAPECGGLHCTKPATVAVDYDVASYVFSCYECLRQLTETITSPSGHNRGVLTVRKIEHVPEYWKVC